MNLLKVDREKQGWTDKPTCQDQWELVEGRGEATDMAKQ